MTKNTKSFVLPLTFIGIMFFAIGFALGINSLLVPVTGRVERCPFQYDRALLSGICAERSSQQQSRSQGTRYDLE